MKIPRNEYQLKVWSTEKLIRSLLELERDRLDEYFYKMFTDITVLGGSTETFGKGVSQL